VFEQREVWKLTRPAEGSRWRIPFAIFESFALLLCFSVLFLEAAHQSPDTQEPKGDSVLGERITRGIVFEGKLWLLGIMRSHKDSTGGLVSLSLADDSRQVHFQQGVLDIEKIGHDLWVIRRPSSSPRELVLSAWRKDKFDDLARFSSSEKDEPIALVNSASGPAVLSVHAIRILSAGAHEWHQIKLKGKLRGGIQKTAASPLAGDSVYVGFNTGEWGGGLQRVELQTGVVTNIERRDTKELCAGPLNSDCDPVTGVIPDPQNKDCILASVGLVHMVSNGRILRVCGNSVMTLFEKPDTVDGPNGDKMKLTEAFFGLVPAADGGFWAISSGALYRFGADGIKKDEYALPKLRPVSGIYLSYDLPGVIVLRTDANWAVSVSGYTPLVIPLGSSQP
jgi:hypothetical protein